VLIAILLDPGQVGLSFEHTPFLCPDPSVILVVGAFVIVAGIEVVTNMDDDVDIDDDVVDVDLDDVVEAEVDVDEAVGVMYTCAELITAHSFSANANTYH
jgi:hypothetical protein